MSWLAREKLRELERVAYYAASSRIANGIPTGAMVALVPDDPESIAVPGGESPGSLHITLAFLGKAEAISQKERAMIRGQVRQVANNARSVEGQLVAPSLFGDGAIVALVQGQDLPGLRAAIMRAVGNRGEIGSERYPVWVPHMTLAHKGDGVKIGRAIGKKIRCSAIKIAFGPDAELMDFRHP